MSRTDFKEFLLTAVKEKLVTEYEAGVLLAKFDKGEVPDSAMPLSPGDGIEIIRGKGQIGAALTLLLLFLNRRQGYSLKDNAELLALPVTERETIRELVQDDFIAQGTQLAQSHEIHKNTARWQTAFQSAIAYYLIQQAVMGYGMQLAPNELDDLSYTVMAQTAFSSHFADKIAVDLLLGKPLSANAIAARSHLYAGQGRAEWFKGFETALENKYDYVFDYISKDDKKTCEPCEDAAAHGPYKPLKGPYPGEVCEGRGHCRCYRQLRLIKKTK